MQYTPMLLTALLLAPLVLQAYLAAIGDQMPVPNPDYKPGVPMGRDKRHGVVGLFESDQANDPRTYVTDSVPFAK